MPSLTSLRFYKKAKPAVVTRVSEWEWGTEGNVEDKEKYSKFAWWPFSLRGGGGEINYGTSYLLAIQLAVRGFLFITLFIVKELRCL